MPSNQNSQLQRPMWWIRHPSNPILPPIPGSEVEEQCCMNPFVLRVEDTYRLYYAGGGKDGHRRICLATANVSDPNQWHRHGVVLETGDDGDFDYGWTVLPHVVRFPDRWHMYYTANRGYGDGLNAFPGIGLAFSDDGLTFEKYSHNPILAASGIEGDPDCQGMAGGSVIQVSDAEGGTEWRFYYTGCPTLGDDLFLNQQKTICYAVSQDGISWEKKGAILLRDPQRDYVDVAAAGPVVWQEPDQSFRMVYSAIGTRWGYYSICYAESEDGVSWRTGERYGDDLTLGPTGTSWEWQMTEYPSVIREGARSRLFYCGNGYGESGIGTAVSGPLRATGRPGLCELRVVAPELQAEWTYRIPEGLSCDEGVFKTHHHPMVSWNGPTGNGMLWHEWSTNDADFEVISGYSQAAAFGMHFIQGIEYRVIVNHTDFGLDLKFTARNTTKDQTFHNVVGVPCLGYPSESFRDPDMLRTMVLVDGIWSPVGELDRGTGSKCRAHYSVNGDPAIRFCASPFWGDVSSTILSRSVIARTSRDGGYTIATAWDRGSEIWDNQDEHGCIHANLTLGDMLPGETVSTQGRVVLVTGGPENALDYLGFE